MKTAGSWSASAGTGDGARPANSPAPRMPFAARTVAQKLGSLRARLALSFAAAVAGSLIAFSCTVIAVMTAAEQGERHAVGEGEVGSVEENDLHQDVHRVLVAMALAAPFAIGGAAALGLWFARRALAPLKEASARGRAARAAELDLTLPVRGTGDEWDELATTLNTLLADGRSALERIRRFTADAAHELRTPLTAIIGEAEVCLRRERTVDELRLSLTSVREDAVRLAGVVDALLTLARADSGTLLAATEPCALEAVAREAAERALADRRHAGLPEGQVEVSGSSGHVRGDHVLLVRALRNLIDNGLRHGGGQVSVRLCEAGSGRARIEVADSGPGIPAELRPKLFERFARADPARSSGGLGLGLAIARAIAKAHGGSLELKPSPSGALFELELSSS